MEPSLQLAALLFDPPAGPDEQKVCTHARRTDRLTPTAACRHLSERGEAGPALSLSPSSLSHSCSNHHPVAVFCARGTPILQQKKQETAYACAVQQAKGRRAEPVFTAASRRRSLVSLSFSRRDLSPFGKRAVVMSAQRAALRRSVARSSGM